ncbi:hypothetical protein H5410_038974 [Solanum commersonii]|uniref:Protein kinase domain-containing protein n=1 Tax=Solanum commersonii TaxID=4109 RepID=A0A9J5YFE6_SOLCO|nr:hypothetical protein H5410_038974 [Solanum commersonii]
MIKKIKRSRKLPDKLEDLLEEINVEERKGKMKKVAVYFNDKLKYVKGKRMFTKEFEELVLDCLSSKESKRPSEDCITIALKQALLGFFDLHNLGRVHKRIRTPISNVKIKLGFVATIYDSELESPLSVSHGRELGIGSTVTILPKNPGGLPNLELCKLYKWAAATEVFHSQCVEDQSQAQPSQSLYDHAYFEAMIKKIKGSRKLPDKLEDLLEEINVEERKGKMKKVVQRIEEAIHWRSTAETNSNIINVEQWVIQKFQGVFCVALPYMSEGSLRYILSTRFHNGLQEDCITIALKQALLGFFDLHNLGRVHKRIRTPISNVKIKLGFVATIYDSELESPLSISHGRELGVDSSVTILPKNPGGLPINLELCKLYKWAAAPEVFHSRCAEDQSQAQPSQSLYVDACLFIPIYDLLEEINVEEGKGKMKKVVVYFNGKLKYVKGKRMFSKEFEELVLDCLSSKEAISWISTAETN